MLGLYLMPTRFSTTNQRSHAVNPVNQ